MPSTPPPDRRAAALLLAAVLLPVLACQRPPAHPNVLLVSIDACRADHLSAYGYPRPTSPFLAELAAGGVRFAQAFANTHGTTPSHTTLLSSLYQETHRVEWATLPGAPARDAVPEQVEMLQEILRRAGYRTLAVTDGGQIGHKFGFARGFDRFDDRGGGVATGAAKLLAMVRDAAPRQGGVFALFHTYEVHSPYAPPAAYRDLFGSYASSFEPTSENLLAIVHQASEKLGPEDLAKVAALYDAGIRYTDDTLRRLFADLAATGFLDGALVIVTGDHGEELADHGGLLHRDLLYQELLHVPLIVSAPRLPRGRVDERLVGLVDVAPTVLGYLGLPPGADMAGRDLFAADGGPWRDAVFSQYRRDRYAVRTRRWKLIETMDPHGFELFDVTRDLTEQHDVAAAHPVVVAELAAALEDWRAAHRPLAGAAPAVELDQEQRRQLEALGYVGN